MRNKIFVYCLNICLGILVGCYIITGFSGTVSAGEFPDTADSWARMAIDQLEANGVLAGYPDGLFRPASNISRAEFSKLIIEALGEGDEAEELASCRPAFIDVPAEHWANAYICLGQEMGLLKGRGEFFEPEVNISRQEVACILSRVFGDSELADEEKEDLPFTDREDIAAWALPDVSRLYDMGMIKGFKDASFKPQEKLNRAEAAALLQRVMDEKGILASFNGILKEADFDKVIIKLANREVTFKLASEAVFFENNRAVDSLAEFNNVRISFNVNSSGEIKFAHLTYEDTYLDVNIKQMNTVSLPPVQEKFGVTVLSAGENDESHDLPADNSGEVLQIAQEVSGIEHLHKDLGVSGQGVVIAVIDSGIDPVNRNLQRTASNNKKIVDWVNFTDEGRVRTEYLLSRNEAGHLETSEGEVIMHPGVYSLSGQYRYGWWKEDWISYASELDYTGNKKSDDSILVVLVDSKEAGVYDQVLVDTNNNLNLADEISLQVFREHKYSYASFPPSADLAAGFPFVLCDIAADGSEVVFGYDSEGHGTHVAGIAAASGDIQGVAPNAQLMALKVADSSGAARLEDTLQAVEYAVSKGADIINISLAFYPEDNEDLKKFRNKLNQIARNTLICTATGNNGPGLASLAIPGDTANVLSVGAYISPILWEAGYGWKVGMDSLYYFSSTGPGQNAILKPDLLAPGLAVSTYPAWTGRNYVLNEGSSMAAPFVSGTAALLMEAMWESGRGFNSLILKNALIAGAMPLEQFSLVEQGHGVLDAYKSWEVLQDNTGLPKFSQVKPASSLYQEAEGLFSKELLPGIDDMIIDNQSGEEAEISWESKTDWMTLDKSFMHLPASCSRRLEVTYEIPSEPGLYCGLLEGKMSNSSSSSSGSSIEILSTLIIPEEWDKKGEFSSYNSLAAGQLKRYYLQVPVNARQLDLELKILGGLNYLQGRARLHIYEPGGNLYKISEYAGLALEGLQPEREVLVPINNPLPGTWEVVVYSSATLSNYNRKTSDYVLTASLKEEGKDLSFVESEFIVGCGQLKENADADRVVLNILNAESKKPYDGRLLINDRLYYVEKGKVKIHSKIERQTLTLLLRKVD